MPIHASDKESNARNHQRIVLEQRAYEYAMLRLIACHE